MMLTAMKSVSCLNLNLRCTSTNQSTKIFRMLSVSDVCLGKYSLKQLLRFWVSDDGYLVRE